MPRITVEFDLPEEQYEYDVSAQAPRLQSCLWEFSQQLRSWQKYYHDFNDANDALDKIREEFYKIIKEHDVNIDL